MLGSTGSLSFVDHALGLLAVVVLYFGSFSAVIFIVEPAQQLLESAGIFYGNLIFLPHGIRILVVWLYGWWGALYLLPVIVLTTAVYSPELEITVSMMVLSATSVAAVVLSFLICRALGILSFAFEAATASWKELLLIGSMAAFLNAVLHWLVLPNASRFDFSAIFIGDILGLLLMLILLMLTFRAARTLSRLGR
jgi:hypothetical protein